MRLVQPEWLWILAIVPLVTLWSAFGRAKRGRDWLALGSSGKPPRDGAFLWMVAVLFFAIALARPRWGNHHQGPPIAAGRDFVLLVDVSRSMGARDAVPDRLSVAVESAESLVNALGRSPGDRVAVVEFAGRGVKRCPLTQTLGAVIEALHDLKPGGVQPGGPDLGAALDAARETFDDQDHAGGRTVVLFSDGEDHEDRWREALDRVRGEGIVVHTVAVGDPGQGREVPSSSGEPLEFQGETVLSTRTDKTLEMIAKRTEGAFIPLGLSMTDLGKLYQSRIEPVAVMTRISRLVPEPPERFGVFLLFGLTVAIAATWPTRPRPFARTGRLHFAALCGLIVVAAGATDDPPGMIASGRTEFAAGRFDDALSWFEKAILVAPAQAVPRYDAAAALYRLGRFEEAATHYRAARARAAPPLQTKIDFALGNTMLCRGDFATAIRHYEDCIASRVPGTDLDRTRQDALINKNYTEEQARNTLATPDSEEKPERSQDTPRTGNAPSSREKSAKPSPGNTTNAPEGGPPTGLRGSGGAGGSGPAPPRSGSPEDQLAHAVDDVKKARAGRLPEVVLPEDRDHIKDW